MQAISFDMEICQTHAAHGFTMHQPSLKTILFSAAMLLGIPGFAANYSAKQLSLPNDIGFGCDAFDINDAAQVTGVCYTSESQPSNGFFTAAKGKYAEELGLLSGTVSYGYGINNSGTIVGGATLTGDEIFHATIRYKEDIGLTDIGTLGSDYAYAYAINDYGLFTGMASTPSGEYHVFIANLSNPHLVDIGGLGGGYTAPRAINKHGIIVGSGWADGVNSHAFYAKSPSYIFVDLGTLGGTTSYARAINDNGLIVGYSRVPSLFTLNRAFVVDLKNGSLMRDLGTPVGQESFAYSVNNHGQIVGQFMRTDYSTEAAFLCTGDCSDFVDLNLVTSKLPMGVILVSAQLINKKGRIVAKGSDKKLYLLTPQ